MTNLLAGEGKLRVTHDKWMKLALRSTRNAASVNAFLLTILSDKLEAGGCDSPNPKKDDDDDLPLSWSRALRHWALCLSLTHTVTSFTKEPVCMKVIPTLVVTRHVTAVSNTNIN
ncbi:hypothetical protein L798_08324 [Zootermopsis nevadensis]|uniref:Uncharacterized protein n=1 Tax=Zootermopsis nevadensis TaxID=136037 RepID=A0A067R5B6_ZOONE|nr:hypothetical protein L798_08324 [Zootermopsis nevadensis]